MLSIHTQDTPAMCMYVAVVSPYPPGWGVTDSIADVSGSIADIIGFSWVERTDWTDFELIRAAAQLEPTLNRSNQT